MQKYYTPSKLPFFAMAILTTLQDYLPFYLLSAKTQNSPPLSKKPETPQEHPKKYNCPNWILNAPTLKTWNTSSHTTQCGLLKWVNKIWAYISLHTPPSPYPSKTPKWQLHLCVGAQFSLKCKALAKALCFCSLKCKSYLLCSLKCKKLSQSSLLWRNSAVAKTNWNNPQ